MVVDPGLNALAFALESMVCAAGISIGAGSGFGEGCGDTEVRDEGSIEEGLGYGDPWTPFTGCAEGRLGSGTFIAEVPLEGLGSEAEIT